MHSYQYPLILLVFFIAGFASLFGNENGEDEFYILPDFVVTDDDDKGYYSANTLAGTRTNELTKNIPMTISTVNAEMIEDFKMKTLEDLGNFVPSIEAEGNVYNNQEFRFRGLLTKNQLYEFVPRYSPTDWYNVQRADIIRGSNSLIYGQADPGGKVNLIAKRPQLNKNKGSINIEVGNNSWHKFLLDYNYVINDQTAARFMFIDRHKEFDQNYKYQSFTGSTIELLHQLSPRTRLRLHLEQGEANRSLIGNTFKIGGSPTGLPSGIVADPKIADLMSDELFEYVRNFQVSPGYDGMNPYSIYSKLDGVNMINGFVDYNSDNKIGSNYTDWNGNNQYDSVVYFGDENGDNIWNENEVFYNESELPSELGNIINRSEPFENVNGDNIFNDSDYALMERSDNPKIYPLSESGGILVPDFVKTREDIKKMFRGINYKNTGTGQGPASYSNKSFDYIVAEVEHSFNDSLSGKLSFAYEDLWDKQLAAGYGANTINFSSGYGNTTRVTNYRSLNEYNSEEINDGINSPFIEPLIDLANANHAGLILNELDVNMDGKFSFDEKERITREITNRLNPNRKYDPGEIFTDDDGDGVWDQGEELIDGWQANPLTQINPSLIQYLDKGDYEDSNNNNVWDEGEQFIEKKDGQVSNAELAKYFTEVLLNLDDTDNQFEMLYEIGKFGGRVKNFLDSSHQIYGESYGYLWNWTKFQDIENNGQSLSDILYNVVTGSNAGTPETKAIKIMYDLDRYIDVEKYRTELIDFSNSGDFSDYENRENFSYVDVDFINPLYDIIADQGDIVIDSNTGATFQIDKNKFKLEKDGEKLIYDAIPVWVLQNQHGQMITLDGVEISGVSNPEEFDNKLNGNDPDEVDLQRRAMAKEIYRILLGDEKDQTSNNEFWDAQKEVKNFFKYALNDETNYDWMWNEYIQPSLLLSTGALLEDTNYFDESSIIDFNNDGIADATMPSVSGHVIDVIEPFIKRKWVKTTNRDKNKSARLTFNFNEKSNLIPGKQQILFGLDLDKREAIRAKENQVRLDAVTYGNAFLNTDILSDYILLHDFLYGTSGTESEIDNSITGQDIVGASSLIFNGKIPLNSFNLTEWKNIYLVESDVSSKGIWLASSGSYFDGRLRTLIGIRRDNIRTDSIYTDLEIKSVGSGDNNYGAVIKERPQTFKDTFTTPSIGGLFWLNKSIAIFGNYSKSVISPNGFQFDVFGEITPPETGKGKELGFKFSSTDNKFNGQLIVFSIDKKNEQRQNVNDPMLKALYPAKNRDGTIRTEPYDGTVTKTNPDGYNAYDIYDFYFYKDRFGRDQIDNNGVRTSKADFNKKGNRLANEEVRSEGLELDFYYNPSKEFSVIFGYAYVDTTILKSSLKSLEGLTTAGTSDHNLNLTFKYTFKQGKYKNVTLGLNNKYRSKALLSHYFIDLDEDGQADYFPVQKTPKNSSQPITLEPKYHTFWLEDQFNTDLFVKWAGKFNKNSPYTVLQLNINNIFNNRDLVSTGLNNAHYTEGRNIALSAGFYF